jgi:ubiquinone/menaquinone biosynthesis C-methylase UbiE
MIKGRDQFSIREPLYLETFKPFSADVSFEQIARAVQSHTDRNGKPLDCLDSMAGIGIVGRKIREMIGGLRVVYQDKSRKMLDSDKYDEKEERILCDATQLSIPDDSFDIVLCRAGLNNIAKEDYPKVLREYVRVLRPKGIGVLQDHFAQTPETKETLNRLETEISRLEGKEDETYVPTVAELKDMLQEAGAKPTAEQTFDLEFSLNKRFASKGINKPDLTAIVEILKGQVGLNYRIDGSDTYITYRGITISFEK